MLLPYPNDLIPTASERLRLPSGRLVDVPKTMVTFKPWTGTPISHDLGGKPLLEVRDRPMFAELAIRSHFEGAGWDSRWVGTFGAGKKSPYFLSDWADRRLKEQPIDPIKDPEINDLLHRIEQHHGGFSGFWDVLAWKGPFRIFAEAKRYKKDRMRETQTAWLESALAAGLSIGSFLIVEWQFKS